MPPGRIRKILRRSFMVGATAITGGVAFGIWQVSRPLANPLVAGAGEAVLNPHVLIDAEGVTIIAARAEMGQGIHTTLAAMVAEEMDLDWDSLRVIHGPAGQAYYNARLPAAGLPWPDYAMTDFQRGIADRMGVLGRTFGLQVTGGSTSTRDGMDRMRMAGATARETLRLAAADRLGLAVTDLRTENGTVIAPDGRAIPYPDLAQAAALIVLPEVELRPASSWRYLGRDMPRKDMEPKVMGTATFGIDIRLPGMKFATIRRSPRRAGMRSMDATHALTLPGVERVIELRDGFAVIASNTWLAFQGAEAVAVEWEDAPYPPDTAAMTQAIAAAFDTKPDSTLRDDGDAGRAIADATEITAEYHVPWLAHATMEPMNATALHGGDRLEVWAGNQAPVFLRDRCAEVAGLPASAVTVHTPLMGGGFGRRGETDFAVDAAEVATAMQGVPVQVTWTREEDMRRDFYRPAAMARFRGVVREGQALLLDGRIAAPSVTRQMARRAAGMTPPGADKGHVEGAFDAPYGIPDFRISGHIADLAVPVGAWRAVGSSFNGFFMETFIDEMAHAAGRDPLDFRQELAAREHAPSASVLEAVRQMSGWSGQTAEGRGRGVGFTHSFGTPCAQVVEVEAGADGRIRIRHVWIACDVGLALDPRNIEAQMISGAIFGFSAAMLGEITFAEGEAQQANFPDYDMLRMHNTPSFEVAVLETSPHMGGVGEPGTPPAMPALANALFDLTGIRARSLPLRQHYDLLL